MAPRAAHNKIIVDTNLILFIKDNFGRIKKENTSNTRTSIDTMIVYIRSITFEILFVDTPLPVYLAVKASK
ncbi:hypothetical protein [Lapidilactobacillus gannanensis]|uniref:hypothetical protein n=1 Tax=Lapidilactobacillus gannanensis TaxID=2486002 RepID=UPI0013DE1089|nr:hypothetical protein [Lapidilactobacillus gannanensis]